MTVSSTNGFIQYAGDGSTKTFSLPFYFILNSDIAATVSDPRGNLTYPVNGTDFTVTGEGDDSGGAAAFNTAYPAGYKILFYRSPPVTQETKYYENGKFPAASHERALDKLTMLVQKFSWWFDNLGLKKPSFLADYFDANNNRISNLKAPSLPGDATNKNYVDSGLARAVRVPEDSVSLAPNKENRKNRIFAWNDNGDPIAVIAQSGSASDVLIELAKPTGGSRIGLPTGTDLTSYLSTARGIDPRMPPYNYRDSDDLATRTASIQAAFDAANTNNSIGKRAVYLAGFYRIDKLRMYDHSDYAIVGFGGFILEGAGGSGVFGIDMKNCRNINFEGTFSINGKSGYAGAMKVWSDVAGGTSLMNIRMTAVGFDIAYQFGDFSYPDALISEINLSDSYTYNVRSCLWAIGSQTVINVSRCNLIATDGSIGTTQIGVVTMYGGSIKWSAGEVLMPNVPAGQLIRSFPINSPLYAKAYGIITITGAAIESAGLWFIAYNINNITSPAAGTGGFILIGCTGYAPFNGQNIQIDGNFSGKIDIDHTCFFHREQAGAKTTVTVICSSNSFPLIRMHNDAFDDNFLKGFSAITGGIPVFPFRQIAQVTNLGGVTYGVNSTTDIVFQAKSGSGENPYYASYYNNANGQFVVPNGGLKSVRLHVEISLSAAIPTGTISAIVGGVTKGVCGIPATRVCASFDVGDVAAGAVIVVRIFNPGAAVNTTTSNLDMLVISAAN